MSAIEFNHAATNASPPIGEHVTFAIRTDALHATDLLIQGLAEQRQAKTPEIISTVKDAYRNWGHKVLESFARSLDYGQYGFDGNTRRLSVQFYDAQTLTNGTIANAKAMVPAGKTPMLISLDDMITNNGHEKYPEIAFSRLFSLDGREEMDYIARPGHKPVVEQIKTIAQILQARFEETGERTPIVLLEDNVRRAKMLNWVIDLMDQQGVFNHGEIAGISSCFCNAAPDERDKIVFEGKSVPVKAVVNCDPGCVVDVATTRDLLFDGFVTEYSGTIGRLPGIFMDVAKRFKISPDRTTDFREEIATANIAFCQAIEKEFGVNPPLAWFDGGPIISRIMGCDINTPMADIMERARITMSANPAAAKSNTDESMRVAPVAAPAAACRPL